MVQKHGWQILLTFGRKYKRLAFQQTNYNTLTFKRSRGRFKRKVCASSVLNVTTALGMQLTRCRDGERAAIRRLTRIMSSAALQEGNWLTYSDKTFTCNCSEETLLKPNTFTASNPDTTSTAYQNEWTTCILKETL